MLSQEQQLMETHVKENYIFTLVLLLCVLKQREHKACHHTLMIILLPPALSVFHVVDSCLMVHKERGAMC